MTRFPWPVTFFLAALIFSVVAAPHAVQACGWWGDGEMSQEDEAVEVDADGDPIGEDSAALGLREGLVSKVPFERGYGMAVMSRDRAVPYLDAVGGRKIKRISQLHEAGFAAVVDVGTPPGVARLHRAETEAMGMLYFSIPVAGSGPTPDQMELFKRITEEAANLPLVVYSARADLVSEMWRRSLP
ncbi:MAG: hypothetical protein V3R66_02885 [Rhodospirillales bacterium]